MFSCLKNINMWSSGVFFGFTSRLGFSTCAGGGVHRYSLGKFLLLGLRSLARTFSATNPFSTLESGGKASVFVPPGSCLFRENPVFFFPPGLCFLGKASDCSAWLVFFACLKWAHRFRAFQTRLLFVASLPRKAVFVPGHLRGSEPIAAQKPCCIGHGPWAMSNLCQAESFEDRAKTHVLG